MPRVWRNTQGQIIASLHGNDNASFVDTAACSSPVFFEDRVAAVMYAPLRDPRCPTDIQAIHEYVYEPVATCSRIYLPSRRGEPIKG